jgi:pimeloyl-ACP methyl ester carboxylesterase
MVNVTPVFIPGLLCTEWLFHGQANIASDTAVFADTRQHDTITGMAEEALAKTSGKLVPIGFSMGGYVALEMARLAPARISAIALFSTNCRQDNDVQRFYREKVIKLAQTHGFQGVTRQFLGKLLSPQALADTALVDGVLAMAIEIGHVTFARQQHAILERRAQHETLAALKVPLSIVCGINDKLTPPDLSKEMAEAAPHADLRLLPDVGHLSTLEAADACRDALVDLMARL